jgi:hypothetical protein
MFIHLATEFITDELPSNLSQDAQGNPRVPADAELTAAGWYRFTVQPEPATLPGQRAMYTRTTSGADCTQAWTVAAMTPAEIAAALAVPRKITKLAFRNRFTAAEKVTMEMAALDNPAASMAQRQQAAMLRVNLADTVAATWIDLSRADTRAGVQILEAAGLLAAGRALVILDAPVLPEERLA